MGEKDKYVNLNVCLTRPEFFITIEDFIERVASDYDDKILGYSERTLENAMEFYGCCKMYEIKPLIGIHRYYSSDGNNKIFSEMRMLYLYAMNSVGYNNLIRLENQIGEEGIFNYSAVKDNAEGVLCLYRFNKNHSETEERIFSEVKSVFKDNLYVYCGLPEWADDAREFASTHGTKAVVFDVVMYVDNSDYKKYLEIRRGILNAFPGKLTKTQLRVIHNDYGLKNYWKMIKKYPNAVDLIENTVEIADRCNFELEVDDIFG